MNLSPRIARIAVASVALAMIPVAGWRFLNPVELRFVFSSDATDVLEGPIEAFNDEYAGRIEVIGEEGSSGKIEGEIAQGAERPEMWMPASSTWGKLLNFDAQVQLVPDDNPSYFYSPEVFASWHTVDEQINEEIGPMGWKNLFRLNELDIEEGKEGPLGEAEVSPFRFGHTRATTSTSGLYSVVSQYAVAMGAAPGALASKDFNSANMRRPEVVDRVEGFELSVRNYGDVAQDFCPPLAKYRAGNYSALYMQETTLLTCRLEHGAEGLLEIYPEEGSFVADYPFIILSAEWVTPEEREAAEEFRAWLGDNLSDDAILEEYLRAGDPWDTEPDPSPAGAADARGAFRPLPVPDVDVLAQARLAWRSDIRKIGHVVILLDHSDDMNDDGRWSEACEMLRKLLRELNDQTQAGVVFVDDGVDVEVSPEEIDENAVPLNGALDPNSSPSSSSQARLSAGILEALELPTVSDEAINLLIVVSTGKDTSPGAVQGRAIQALGEASELRSPVQVFTVFLGDPNDPGKEHLAQIAGAGNGTAWNLDGPDAVTTEDVVEDLSSLVPVRA